MLSVQNYNYMIASSNKKNETVIKQSNISYGDGIKLQRLVDGKVCEILEDSDDESDEENQKMEGHRNSITNTRHNHNDCDKLIDEEEREDVEEFSLKMFSTMFKTRKNLQSVISVNKTPSSVSKLNIIGTLLFVQLIALVLISYFWFFTKQFDNINNNIDYLKNSYIRVAELQNILSKIQHLQLLNVGISAYNTSAYNAASIEAHWKTQIEESINMIEFLQNNLQYEAINITLSNTHKSLLTTNVVKVKHVDGNTGSFDLNEAIKQIIAKAFNIKKTPLSSLTHDNTDVFFINYNMFNDFYINIIQSSQYFLSEYKNRNKNAKLLFFVITSISIVFMFFGMAIIFGAYKNIQKVKNKTIQQFLELDEKVVKNLYNKCESFISNIQVGEDDENLSDQEENSKVNNLNHNENEEENLCKSRRKKSKNTSNYHTTILSVLTLAFFLICMYFIIIYFKTYKLLNNNINLIKEINVTVSSESFYYYAYNAQFQLYKNRTQNILTTDPSAVVDSNIKNQLDLEALLHDQHSLNINIFNKDYFDKWNEIIITGGGPCGLIPDLVNAITEDECSGFASKSLKEGLALGLSLHLYDLYSTLNLYKKYEVNPNLSWEETGVTCPSQNGFTNRQNNKFCLTMQERSTEIDIMQNNYIKNFFRDLMKSLQNDINQNYINTKKFNLTLTIPLIALQIPIWLFIWLPWVQNLSIDMCKTNSILSAVPLTVMSEIRPFRMFVKKCMNDYNLTLKSLLKMLISQK